MDDPGEENVFRRCNRRASRGWRCKERAMSGRKLCERHFLYMQQRVKGAKKENASGGVGVYRTRRIKERKNSEGDLKNGVVGDGGKGLFDEHNGGPHVDEGHNDGVNLGLGFESFDLLGERGGQHFNLGDFGGRCGNLSQVEGQVLGEPRGNGSTNGVSDAVQGVHASGDGVAVCENGFLDLSSEDLEGLMVEADFGSLYDQGFQALLCQGEGCEEDVIYIGSDRAMPNFSAPGGPGLSGENAFEFGGEEVVGCAGNPGGYGKVEGETIGSIEVPGSNGMQNGNTGSNGKMIVLGVEGEAKRLLDGGVVTSENAKGSENKYEQIPTILNGQTFSENDQAGIDCMTSATVLGSFSKDVDEGAVLDGIVRPTKSVRPKDSTGVSSVTDLQSVSKAGDERAGLGEFMRPKKRGRPTGTSMSNVTVLESERSVFSFEEGKAGGEGAGLGDIVRPRKRGRLKGLNMMNNVRVLESERSVFSVEEGKAGDEGAGRGEIVRSKKCGQPKDSSWTSNVKVLESERPLFSGKEDKTGDQGVVGDIVRPEKRGQPKGSNKTSTITVLESERLLFSGKEDKVGDEDADLGEIGRTKKRGRPKGSRNKKNIFHVGNKFFVKIAGIKKLGRPKGSTGRDTVVVFVGDKVGGEIALPKKRGRPKGSKNKIKDVEVGNEVAGVGEIAGPKKLGRPKGSKGRKKSIVLVGEITGPKKLGRPKGSKNKMNNVVEVGNEVADTGEIAGPKKHGRPPKGSAKIKKDVVEVTNEIDGAVETTGLKKRGRPKSSTQKWRTVVCASSNEVAGEIARYKNMAGEAGNIFDKGAKMRGRPKGSNRKEKEFAPGFDSQIKRHDLLGEKEEGTSTESAFINEPNCVTHSICFSKGLSRIMPQNNVRNECISMLEDQVNEGVGGEESLYHGLESSALNGDTGMKNDTMTLRCHQCWQRSKNGIVICTKCKRKRYPDKTREEIETACPFCLGNCNCRLCLKEDISMVTGTGEADTDVKLQRLFYLLDKILPLLQNIQLEQRLELEVEASMRGSQLLEEKVLQSLIDDNERVYWYYLMNPHG
ncbi:hypothetical protein Fmac_032017 [Flemingia macrophylla]|uniref:WRC domain-containing protein n=1 Tax=Flemingia macrophylla TaxID=520843 RepID=A0ABD1L3Q4_9FABA